MEKKVYMYVVVALLIGGLGGYVLTLLGKNEADDTTKTDESTEVVSEQEAESEDVAEPDRGNCLGDDCLLVEDLEYPAGELPPDVQEALSEAINDEYKALSTYEAVIAKFGAVRPFSMIKGAEEQHIASLKTIYDKYGLEVPENTWPGKVEVPASLQEACQIGVDAEIANAALYENELLPAVEEYDDITAVFTNLMNASEEKHLPAFERCD